MSVIERHLAFGRASSFEAPPELPTNPAADAVAPLDGEGTHTAEEHQRRHRCDGEDPRADE